MVHGDTWNMAHECLVADVRRSEQHHSGRTKTRTVASRAVVRRSDSAGSRLGQRDALHSHGSHWTAQEPIAWKRSRRIIHPESALDKAIQIANKIAACGPLGIKTSLASAQLAIDAAQADALSKLDAQRAALYRTQDFQEGRKQKLKGGRQFITAIERALHHGADIRELGPIVAVAVGKDDPSCCGAPGKRQCRATPAGAAPLRTRLRGLKDGIYVLG